jgi:glycerate kinase
VLHIPTTILVAPHSFKGTLPAPEVADAIGCGLEQGGWEVDLCPVAECPERPDRGERPVPEEGAAFALDLLDFDRRMLAARAVVTGEARLDQQSLAGTVVSEVATRTRQAGVPCHAIVGERRLDAFGARILDLQAVLEARTPAQLRAAGHKLARLI